MKNIEKEIIDTINFVIKDIPKTDKIELKKLDKKMKNLFLNKISCIMANFKEYK